MRTALEHRDESIRQMRAEGATLRAIAEAAGLTHQAIAKILAK
jgi:lambda repressor-like predicted transcriptional regulator